MIYKKINKVLFSDGTSVEPEEREWMIYDNDHLIVVNEEDMTIKVIETEEKDFQLFLSHEKVEHPIVYEDPEIGENWLIEGQNHLLNSVELDQIGENIYEYMSSINLDDEEIDIDDEITKKVSIDSIGGKRYQVVFGAEVCRKKMTPFFEIVDRSRKKRQTVLKIHLNKTNIKKIFNSIQSLKKVLDQKFLHNHTPKERKIYNKVID